MKNLAVTEPPIFGGKCTITDMAGSVVGYIHLRVSSLFNGSSGIVTDFHGRTLMHATFNFGVWDMETRRSIAISFVEASFPESRVTIAGPKLTKTPITVAEFGGVLRSLLPSTPTHPVGMVPASLPIDAINLVAADLYPNRTCDREHLEELTKMFNPELEAQYRTRLEWVGNTLHLRVI